MNTVMHSIMNIKMGKTLKKQLNFIQILKISRNMQFAANYDIYMNKNKYSNASNSNVWQKSFEHDDHLQALKIHLSNMIE